MTAQGTAVGIRGTQVSASALSLCDLQQKTVPLGALSFSPIRGWPGRSYLGLNSILRFQAVYVKSIEIAPFSAKKTPPLLRWEAWEKPRPSITVSSQKPERKRDVERPAAGNRQRKPACVHICIHTCLCVHICDSLPKPKDMKVVLHCWGHNIPPNLSVCITWCVMNGIVFSPSIIPIAPLELRLGHQEHRKTQLHGTHCIVQDTHCSLHHRVPLWILWGSETVLLSIWFASVLQTVSLCALTVKVRPDLHGPHLPRVHILMACILCPNFILDFILSSLPSFCLIFIFICLILCHALFKCDIKSFPERTTALN